MREIKFRAYSKEVKKMFYNIQETYDGLHEEESGVDEDLVYRISCISCFADWLKNKDIKVMQFTGLKDKNKKEIWEGDILKCFDRKPFLMEIKSAGGCGCCDSDTAFGWWFSSCLPEDCEVIGNLFEQSYLLDNKEEED